MQTFLFLSIIHDRTCIVNNKNLNYKKMNKRRNIFYILIFLFCSFSSAFAQKNEPSGIELCNEVHSFLKKNGFSPSSQSLVVSGENTFPYNIIVTFAAEQNTSPENLLLVFFQEDVLKNQDILKETLIKIKEAEYPFTITALFAYGEKQVLETADMIYGTEVFLESLNTNLSYTAVIFDLESDKNIIETTAQSLSSPPRLIKNSMNLYKSCGIGANLPSFVLSQLASYSFISCRSLKAFFNYEIPAIKLSISSVQKADKKQIAVKIITGFIEAFSKTSDTSWEHHFLIINLFGSYHTVSERMILRIVTPTIFLWLLFIFILVFVNRRMKRHTWSTIGNIWWSVPLTYMIISLTFLVAGQLFRNITPDASYAGRIYGQLIFQISTSLFITLSVYLIILTLNYRFTERAVDYLLVISCFINQSVFILTDISLSPIFIIICFLSLIALTVKNNYLHVAVFLLMIAPLIPYCHRIISTSNLQELSNFVSGSRGIYITIPLVLYPVYLVLFRIISSVRSSRKKISFVIISTSLAFLIISAVLISFGIIRSSGLNKKQIAQKEIEFNSLGNELISLSVSDRIVFDDTIRTLDVNLNTDCLICDVLISTEDTNPILYSDNDYTNPAANTARFRIPDNPPREMSFSYGAAKVPCKITVSAVIEGSQAGDFQFITRSLEIGDN